MLYSNMYNTMKRIIIWLLQIICILSCKKESYYSQYDLEIVKEYTIASTHAYKDGEGLCVRGYNVKSNNLL